MYLTSLAAIILCLASVGCLRNADEQAETKSTSEPTTAESKVVPSTDPGHGRYSDPSDRGPNYDGRPNVTTDGSNCDENSSTTSNCTTENDGKCVYTGFGYKWCSAPQDENLSLEEKLELEVSHVASKGVRSCTRSCFYDKKEPWSQCAGHSKPLVQLGCCEKACEASAAF